jgi:hypothetical protein
MRVQDLRWSRLRPQSRAPRERGSAGHRRGPVSHRSCRSRNEPRAGRSGTYRSESLDERCRCGSERALDRRDGRRPMRSERCVCLRADPRSASRAELRFHDRERAIDRVAVTRRVGAFAPCTRRLRAGVGPIVAWVQSMARTVHWLRNRRDSSRDCIVACIEPRDYSLTADIIASHRASWRSSHGTSCPAHHRLRRQSAREFE